MEDFNFDDLLFPQEFQGDRELIERYKKNGSSKSDAFYDVEDFEIVIDYFITMCENDKALETVKKALRQHPGTTSIQLKKANIYLQQGHISRSSKLLENLILLEPFNPDIHQLIAMLHNRSGDSKNAILSFKNALKYCDPNDKGQMMFDLAMEYTNIEDFNAALELLFEVVKENPEEGYAIYELQFCLQKAGKLGKGVELFNEIIDLNPYSVAAWFNLGVTYGALNMHTKALESYDFALAVSDKHTPSLFNKGNTLYKLELFEEALEAYQMVVELEEPMAIAYCNMGECYEQLMQFKKAIRYYKKALEMDPNFADAYIGCAIAKDLIGDTRSGIGDIERALEISPLNTDYRHFYAEMLKKADMQEEAVAAFKKTLELNNDDINVYLGYFDCLFKLNDDDKALDVIMQGFRKIGQHDELNIRLLALLTRQGKLKKTTILLETLLNSNRTIGKRFLTYHPQAIKNKEVIELINEYS